ncbi:MAG: hypothetical protein AB1721_02285 [Patescibacteria group bacterium]
MNHKRFFRAIFLLFTFCYSLFAKNVFAADFLLVDWQANNYAPEEYRLNAKNPALPGSTVNLRVNLFQDKGKGVYQPVDLSGYTIRWLSQGYKISELKGINRLSYTINKFTNDSFLNLTAQIVDPVLGSVAQKQVLVPIFQAPEALLHLVENDRVSPYSQETFFGSPEQELVLAVRPYFFNVANVFGLNLQWYYRLDKIDNSEKDKLTFRAKLPKNPVKDLFSVFVQNSKSELEFVKQNFYLTNK